MVLFDFNTDDEKIIKAIPKKGTFDISDLSGRTLYPPSRVNTTVQKLVNQGYLIIKTAGEQREQPKGLKLNIGKVGDIKTHEISKEKLHRDEVYILSDSGGKIKLMIDSLVDSSYNLI